MDKSQFLAAALKNPVNEIIAREAFELALPDAWLVSGCLAQTVWNVLTGRAVGYGINDYDAFYFDPDTSWDAEDAVIRKLAARLDELGVTLEARNQARPSFLVRRQTRTALCAARLFVRQHRSIPDRAHDGRHPPRWRGL